MLISYQSIVQLELHVKAKGEHIKQTSRYLYGLDRPQDLLLIQKFIRRMNDSLCKIVNGQIFEKAENLWPY